MFAEVLTSAASWQDEHPLLTYLVPGELQPELRAGQLVAVPYGERLVEGIVWSIRPGSSSGNDDQLRPLHTILDLEPVLLPHQRKLAEWIAEYYITPLAQVALMMLPPGLMQRSKIVLRLVADNETAVVPQNGDAAGGLESSFEPIQVKAIPESSAKVATVVESPGTRAHLTTRALIGLLLADGELDVERLKEMLGEKRAKRGKPCRPG